MISTTAGRSFVDTNVLVYAFEKTASTKKRVAQELLRHLMDSDTLRVSTQVLQELFVTLTRKASQKASSIDALSAVEVLTAWPVVLIDVPAIKEAIGVATDAQLSFWDALIVVSASRAGATVLYTEDLNDGQEILGIRICNPFVA